MRRFPKGRSSSGLPIPERVYSFLVEHTPERIGDDCIAKRTETTTEEIAPLTATLGLTTDFEQTQGTCRLCKLRTLVTRSLRYV